MRVRDLSIRSRLNIGFGVCCAAILLLGILVFAGTIGIDGKAIQVLKAADSAGSAQKQVQELYNGIVSINKGLRIWSVVLIAVVVGFSALASLLILNSIKAPINRIAYLFTAIANGDFGVHLGGTKDEFFPIKDAMTILASKWRQLVTDIKANSERLASAAEQLQGSSGEMLGGVRGTGHFIISGSNRE